MNTFEIKTVLYIFFLAQTPFYKSNFKNHKPLPKNILRNENPLSDLLRLSVGVGDTGLFCGSCLSRRLRFVLEATEGERFLGLFGHTFFTAFVCQTNIYKNTINY